MAPNILLIFTDQQRFDTIAALGNPIIRTPALDRLAREGTSFAQHYTPSPVCMAARCAVVTGLPPHTTGCVANQPMPQDQTSFMARLHDAGYQTAGLGKMHFGPDARYFWGFEERLFSEEGSSDGDAFRAYLDANGYGYVQDVHGVRSEYYYLPQPSQLPARLHHSQWLADQSIYFLERRDRARPFFLWTSFIKPHPPFENPTPWNKLYRGPEMPPPFRPEGFERLLNYWNHFQNRYKYRDAGYDEHLMRTLRAAYYGCISFIDYQIGRILAALGDDIDNTLIVFTSDHGELLGDYGSVGKRCMLDAAARIPLLVRWPAHFAAGARVETPTTLLDLWPTFLSAAGIEDWRRHGEGQDLARVARAEVERRYVFSQYAEGRLGLYMVCDGRYKYIYSAADDREWFFDRAVDARETHSFAYNPLYADETRRLRQAILARFQQDGYHSAIVGDGWRRYEPTAVPTDPDAGLLFQDAVGAQEAIDELGPYARRAAMAMGTL